jgi:hypothetical protein
MIMASKEELKELKVYLSKELSKSYETKTTGATSFEPNKNIRIDEKRHSGDLTRDVFYVTGDLNNFVGYVSFFKKREFPYAVCIADGGGISYHKKASVAASRFAVRSSSKIEDIMWEHENTPVKKTESKFNPELFKDMHEDHPHI